MTTQKHLQSNIWKLLVISGIELFLLIIPIMVPFYQSNGLTMKDVFLLQSIFSISIVLFEIPSGYFADVVGRKNSLVLWCVFWFLGMLIYSFTSGFYGFLVAELVLGFWSSFISGADSAILYDSLLELDRGGEYKKLEWKMSAISNFSEAAASFIWGFLVLVSIRFPFYIESAVLFLAIPIALSIYEPANQKHDNKEWAWKGIIKVVKYSLHHHAETKWLIFYSGFLWASTLTMVWLVQPYFKLVGLPIVYFWIVWAVLNLSIGLFSLAAHEIEAFFGRRKIFILLFALIFLGFLLTSIFHSLWALIFLVIFYFVRAINGPVLKDAINRVTASHIRATVLSVKALIARLIFAIIGPFVGWISDVYTLQTALLISGSMFLFFGSVSIFFLWKHKVL